MSIAKSDQELRQKGLSDSAKVTGDPTSLSLFLEPIFNECIAKEKSADEELRKRTESL